VPYRGHVPAVRHLVVALLGASLTFGFASCGDDESGSASGDGASERTAAAEPDGTTEGAETSTGAGGRAGGGEEAEDGGAPAPDAESPEDQPGGAGDEVPASSLALIVGRRGGYHPTVVHVPPFIAIRVQLRSSDGVEYELSGDGRTLKAGGEIPTVSTTFEGLRTGERLVLSGPQGKVAIEANAEPGP
jgi:hypothetical protein